MKEDKKIIRNESELRQLFKEHYKKMFPDYLLYKEELRIKYKNKQGFIDIILKHKKENKYALIEFKFNKANTDAVAQINKYYIYFKENFSLSSKNIEKYLIDFHIDEELKELCKESNVSYLCLKELPLFKNILFKKIKSKDAKSKIKLTLSVNEGILGEFKKLCDQEGWKIGKQIEKYMQEILRNR